MLLGHARGEPVLLARRGDEVFAIGAICTHYGAPLEQGLLVGDTVRCPWHHACFSLRTGEALRAPALDPVSCWRVEAVRDRRVSSRRDAGGRRVVREKLSAPTAAAVGRRAESVVIVGGGGAGNAAAEMLRREGYSGRLTMLSADASVPCDRPNLSKGFLAGAASEESNPLRSAEFYREHDIDLKLGARVTSIDTASRQVQLADGSRHAYDALLLATGAEPVRLDVPAETSPTCITCGRLPTAVPWSPRPGVEARRGDRRELHRPGGGRVAARAQPRRACGRARGRPDGARSWERRSAISSASCMRSTA